MAPAQPRRDGADHRPAVEPVVVTVITGRLVVVRVHEDHVRLELTCLGGLHLAVGDQDDDVPGVHQPGGGALPFDPKFPGSEFILAFQALPLVLIMSVLTTLLFYWRILPPIVRGLPMAATNTSARRV